MADEPKPCPFCGGTHLISTANHTHAWIKCTACCADGPGIPRQYRGHAIDTDCAYDAWNRRAERKP